MSHRIKRFSLLLIVLNCYLINKVASQTQNDILNKLELIVFTIEASTEESRLKTTEKAIIAIQDGHYNLDIVALSQDQGKAFSFTDATDSEFFRFIADQQALLTPENKQLIINFWDLSRFDTDQFKRFVSKFHNLEL